jgi:hypothetical protein
MLLFFKFLGLFGEFFVVRLFGDDVDEEFVVFEREDEEFVDVDNLF